MKDLQNAFVTVDHEILLHKLKALGFHDMSVLWIESYLRNRKQKTEINGTFSDPGVVSCGVPQESILGPYYFSFMSTIWKLPFLVNYFVCR